MEQQAQQPQQTGADMVALGRRAQHLQEQIDADAQERGLQIGDHFRRYLGGLITFGEFVDVAQYADGKHQERAGTLRDEFYHPQP